MQILPSLLLSFPHLLITGCILPCASTTDCTSSCLLPSSLSSFLPSPPLLSSSSTNISCRHFGPILHQKTSLLPSSWQWVCPFLTRQLLLPPPLCPPPLPPSLRRQPRIQAPSTLPTRILFHSPPQALTLLQRRPAYLLNNPPRIAH